MELIIWSVEGLLAALPRVDPPDFDLSEIFEAYMGMQPNPKEPQEPVTSIVFRFDIGPARSALEDIRRYYIKIDGVHRASVISSVANAITQNYVGAIAGRLTRNSNLEMIDEEFRFVPNTFRWAIGRLYELGWRESPIGSDGLTLIKSEAPRPNQRLPG